MFLHIGVEWMIHLEQSLNQRWDLAEQLAYDNFQSCENDIAEKSMEKTRFYNREDLKAKDVAAYGKESLLLTTSREKPIKTSYYS